MIGSNTQRAEVVIAGGGMVGLTLGIALAEAGVETIVVDGVGPARAHEAQFDGRVSSFAPASCKMLKALGVWDVLRPDAQPVLDIVVGDGSVREGASAALLHFDHREAGGQPLAYMIENRHYRMALAAKASALRSLQLIAPARVSKCTDAEDWIRVSLQNGLEIDTKVCVAAEGRDSPLRDAAGIKTHGWSYHQTGIVVTVEHELPHQGVAHELFLPSGPFAILPMTGNRSSIVWSESTDLAPAFLRLNEAAFSNEVAQRFGDHLGAIKLVGPRWSYPLSLQLALRYVGPRLALAGDAAHGVHPIAGQGLNLGIRDAAALAEVIVEARRLGLDIGSPHVLARYERWRGVDNAVFAASMDLLNRLFSNDIAPLKLARRAGIDIVDSIKPLKRFFMNQAGGEAGNLPRLLHGEAI
jgi:2-octaprenyl-6-methoxyphenol hydroxylase